MKQADTLLLKGKNPLESRRWRKEVEELRLNIHQANHKVTSTKRNVGGAAISASLLFFVPPAGILYAILSLAYFAIMIIFGLIQSRKPLKPLDLQTDRFFSHQQKPSKGQSPPMEPAAQPS